MTHQLFPLVLHKVSKRVRVLECVATLQAHTHTILISPSPWKQKERTFLSSCAASRRYCQSIQVPDPVDTFSSIRSTIFFFVSSSRRRLSLWLAHCGGGGGGGGNVTYRRLERGPHPTSLQPLQSIKMENCVNVLTHHSESRPHSPSGSRTGTSQGLVSLCSSRLTQSPCTCCIQSIQCETSTLWECEGVGGGCQCVRAWVVGASV